MYMESNKSKAVDAQSRSQSPRFSVGGIPPTEDCELWLRD